MTAPDLPALPSAPTVPAVPAVTPVAGTASAPRPRRAPIDWRWAAYAGFWLAVGLLQGLAEWQHYARAGLAHPWEPFLWELSSVGVIAALSLAVWRWDAWGVDRGWRWPRRVAAHLVGAAAFTVAHTALMYALRFVVYGLAGLAYEPGTVGQVLGYEAAKDVVTYVVLMAAGQGLRLLRRAERQSTDLARLEAQLAEARLAHLQSQIQPHFLFNTLNLVSSVMHEDVGRADELLAELADLLRQAEAAGRQPVHALAEELHWVRPFLSIMGQRFGERLSVAIDVDDAAARCTVPSLLLMGPVENAVTHGVAANEGDVRVTLAARVAGPWLEIEVVDEALGGVDGDVDADAPAASVDDTRLADAVARHAALLGSPTPRGRGTGLANTRARLEAHHGADQQVTLLREAARTVLRMRLPAVPGPSGAAGAAR